MRMPRHADSLDRLLRNVGGRLLVGQGEEATGRENGELDRVRGLLLPDAVVRDNEVRLVAAEQVEHKIVVQIDGASPSAKARFGTSVQTYADRLVAKLVEVEERQRQPGVPDPEITSSTVVEAEEEIRRRPEPVKVSKIDISLRIVAPLSSLVTGIFGSYLNSSWQSAIFGASFISACGSTIWSIVRKG